MRNPNLSQAPYDISPELLHERETFNLHDHLKGVKPAPATTLPRSIRLTNDQLKDLCRAAGLEVIDPKNKGGRALNQDEVIEELKTENERLTEKCNRLLERAQLAEASAANAISELKSMQRSAVVPDTTTPPEETI